jgi:xanthine/CO dehydrogenase XdhC/CoxF family maturation factor
MGTRRMTALSADQDILSTAQSWLANGRQVALATVVATWGSAPRQVGSLMAVDDAGRMVGSVSGGCIEGAVVEQSMDAMVDGKTRLLDFGVSDDQAWEVGLACGGKIQIFVEKIGK